MSDRVCCQEVGDVAAQVKVLQGKISTGRWFVAGILTFAGIALLVSAPTFVDFTIRVEGKIDELMKTTHKTELKVEHIATEQVSLRRDLNGHIARTEGHGRPD